MQRKQVDYKSVLSLFLPQGILDYFDIVDYSGVSYYSWGFNNSCK